MARSAPWPFVCVCVLCVGVGGGGWVAGGGGGGGGGGGAKRKGKKKEKKKVCLEGKGRAQSMHRAAGGNSRRCSLTPQLFRLNRQQPRLCFHL